MVNVRFFEGIKKPMKLFIAWEIKGKFVTSPRDSIDLDITTEPTQLFSTVDGTDFMLWWLQDPIRAKFYYDILEQINPFMDPAAALLQARYMCFKMMSYFLGRSGIVVTGQHIITSTVVSDCVLEMAGFMAHSAVLAKVIFTTGYIAVLLGVLWIINPKVTGTRTISWPHGRYMMQYNEGMHWADIIGCSLKGTDIYSECGSISGTVLIQDRRSRSTGPTGWIPGDRLSFGGTWIETSRDGYLRTTISWQGMKASYIGLLKRIGGDYYTLRDGYEPTFVGDTEPGWIKPSEQFCVEPQRTLVDVSD